MTNTTPPLDSQSGAAWIGLAGWTVYGLITAGMISLRLDVPYLAALVTATGNAAAFGLVSIPLWWIARAFPFEPARWLRFFAMHLALSLVFAAAWFALYYSALWFLLNRRGVVEMFLSTRMYYWQFLDFEITYGFLVGLFTTVVFYRKLKQKEIDEAQLALLSREMELRSLKSQINPHFLFNTLNSVNALMSQDPERARTMNHRLAHLLRYALDSHHESCVALERELEFTRNYLAIEKARFGDKLVIEESIVCTDTGWQVPAMLLQPIVENAIRHGIAKIGGGGRLDLPVHESANDLEFVVNNSGRPIDRESVPAMYSGGVGITNTSRRLEQLYDGRASLVLRPNDDGGMTVTIRIPRDTP